MADWDPNADYGAFARSCRDDHTGTKGLNWRKDNVPYCGYGGLLSLDEFRAALGFNKHRKFFDDRFLDGVPGSGGFDNPPDPGRVPKNVIFLFHDMYTDVRLFKEFSELRTRKFLDWFPGLHCLGVFDTNHAAKGMAEIGILSGSVFGQAEIFNHPDTILNRNDFVGAHSADQDAEMCGWNAIAMASNPEYGPEVLRNPNEHSRFWFDPNMNLALEDHPHNLLLVAVDTEYGNYQSREHTQWDGMESGPLKEFGFAVLDLGLVRGLAPGHFGRNWHKYWQAVRLRMAKIPEFNSTNMIDHKPNARHPPRPGFDQHHYSDIVCHTEKSMTETIYKLLRDLALRGLPTGPHGPVGFDARPDQHLAVDVPAFRMSFAERFPHQRLQVKQPAGCHSVRTAIPVPTPAPAPERLPGSVDPGMSLSPGFCNGCHQQLQFVTEEGHDHYLRLLGLVCGDMLSDGKRCRTYTQCQHKIFLCPAFLSRDGCASPHPHDYDMHLARNCKKHLGEGECGKLVGDDVARQQPCYQRTEVHHIRKTCLNLLRGKECDSNACRFGHDHPEVRFKVHEARKRDARANEGKPRGGR